jgi:hypothetical protein
MTIDKCSQTSCGYHPDNDTIPKGKMKEVRKYLCPICPKCSAQKWMISTDCSECLVCETIPDRIRGDGKDKEQIVEQIANQNAEKKIIQELPSLPEFHIKRKAQVTTPTALFILFIGLMLVAYILSLPPELRRVLLG